MIEYDSQAFDEIIISAILQNVINPVQIGKTEYIDMIDYLKIRELEW
jgi:hypothetical protein